MLMAFASGVLLGYMRGRGSVRLTQETALSLLMHWSVCVCVCVGWRETEREERVSVSVCAGFYLRESFMCVGMSNSHMYMYKYIYCVC